MKDPIEIPAKNRSLIITLILVAILTLICFWMINEAPSRRWYFQNPVFWKSLSIVITINGFVVCTLIIRFLLKNKPALVVDSIGLKGNALSFSCGYVYWNNIEKFEIVKKPFQKMIIVFIDAPKSYIYKEQNKTYHKLMEIYFKHHGSPIIIQSTEIKYSLEELHKILNTELMKHQQLRTVI